MQIDMRIYTVAETKTPYFKRDYSLCDFVVQAQRKADRKSGLFFFLFFVGFMATPPHEVVGVSALAHLCVSEVNGSLGSSIRFCLCFGGSKPRPTGNVVDCGAKL